MYERMKMYWRNHSFTVLRVAFRVFESDVAVSECEREEVACASSVIIHSFSCRPVYRICGECFSSMFYPSAYDVRKFTSSPR